MVDISLETDRLILRQWRESDREPFAQMNADPEVMEYFQSELTRTQSDSLVDRIKSHFAKTGFGLFALERKSDGAFLGFTGLLSSPADTPVSGEVEIGWRLARDYWRRGYAFEAASACIDWYWRKTDRARLVSFTSDQNLPSQNLMRKLGLERRPDLDFNHPAIAREDPLSHQVVFAVERDAPRNG